MANAAHLGGQIANSQTIISYLLDKT